jgi:diguanylate cyclase (GGDEF)-like protein
LDEILMQMDRSRAERFELLVVHENAAILEQLKRLFLSWDYKVTSSEGDDFFEKLEEVNPNLILMSCWPRGLSLCRELRLDPRHVDRAIIFLCPREASTQPAYRAGADDCLRWPAAGAEILTRISSHLQRSRARLAVSRLDPLTGLLRWPDSAQAVEQLLSLAARQDQVASIAVIRPDRFPQLLQTQGRLAGNRRFQEIAEGLHKAFRDEDVLTRWGDSEFLVALYGMSRADGVRRLAEVLGHLEVSAGLAQFPEDGTAFQTLYLAAYEALDRAVRAGGGRFVYSGWEELPPEQAVDVHLLAQGTSASGLRRALTAEGYTYRSMMAEDDLSAVILFRAIVVEQTRPSDCAALLRALIDMRFSPDQPVFILSPPNDDCLARAVEQANLSYTVRVFHNRAQLMRELRQAMGCRGAWSENQVGDNRLSHGLLSYMLAVAKEKTEVLEAESARLREGARRLSQELEVARTIQQALLPRQCPAPQGWHITYRLVPARIVGGDLVQFFPHENRTRIVVADVTGKGIPAAILVGSLHQILRQAMRLPLTRSMKRLNETLHQMTPTEVAVAMTLSSLGPAGEVRFYNAGCPFPLLFRRRQRRVLPLTSAGLPLGWFAQTRFVRHSIHLEPGDVLLFYTDGLCDAFFEGTRERVGDARIEETLRRYGAEDPDVLGAHLPDDFAFVLLRREES